MAFQQQENGLFDTKVPIFCEWTFEKNLSNIFDGKSSLYNYVKSLVDAAPDGLAFLTTPEYPLPGFPGIQYFLNIVMEEGLSMDLEIRTKYKEYNFDAEFTCTLTDCEPKHFVHGFNDATDSDTLTIFNIGSCSEDCNGCTICADKKITICVEGTVIVKHVLGFSDIFLKVSDETRRAETNEIKDFVIVVEDQEIWVHKSVLAENSTVFARMLDSDNWKETMESKITIPDFPYKIVKHAIGACYGRNCFNPPLNNEESLILFKFADKYNMEKLIKALKEFMAFTPFNVVEYANFFFQYHDVDLVNCCIDYIFKCSQYSIPIKDIEMLDDQIRAMLFDRMLVSPVLKKDLKHEHRSFNYEKSDNNE